MSSTLPVWIVHVEVHQKFTTHTLTLLDYIQNGLFQEKSKQEGLRIYFFEDPPGTFRFFTLLLEIPDK